MLDAKLREIIAHLDSSVRQAQAIGGFDEIIIDHMREALREANEALDELKHKPLVEAIAPDMWSHYCVPNRNIVETETGQPCNWCDVNERTAMPLVSLPNPEDYR